MKKILVCLLFLLNGCGTVGYRISKRTGDEKFKGEVFWNIIEIHLNRLWIKEVDGEGNEIKRKFR